MSIFHHRPLKSRFFNIEVLPVIISALQHSSFLVRYSLFAFYNILSFQLPSVTADKAGLKPCATVVLWENSDAVALDKSMERLY